MSMVLPTASLQLSAAPARLPVPLVPFIGRAREVEGAVALLQRGDVRLLTLTGPGGVGKTRLALQIAERLEAEGEQDGRRVAFVPLAAISDPELLLPAIAHAVDARLRDEGDDALLDGLQRRFQTPTLLLLDNFEQIIGAASSLAALLSACPALTIVVTSRLSLRISGEQEFPVPPLAVPDARTLPALPELAESEAVALFVQRARAVRPAFALTADNAGTVVELCRRLDGLPLAIELAAARGKVLSPSALLNRLENRLQLLTSGPADAPPRLQTMQAAIAWSYDLLSPIEQGMFRRLSVFVNGFTEESAAAVVAEGGDDDPVAMLDLVTSLVDKSLVEGDRFGRSRFGMLETIRVYGMAQLTASGEERSVRDAHAAYFLGLAETTAPDLWSLARESALERLDGEHDNLRAALDWLAETNQRESLLRLTSALCWFWYFGGYLVEGRRRAERAVAMSEGVSAPVRAVALREAARLAVGGGNERQATEWADESLRLFRALGDPVEIGRALSTLAALAEHRGDDDRAATLYEESWEMLRASGPPVFAIGALLNVCDSVYRLGDLPRAAELAVDGLALARTLGDPVLLSIALGNAGQIALAQGDYGRARTVCLEGLDLTGDAHIPGAADLVVGLAAVGAATGDPAQAARWLAAAHVATESAGLQLVLHHRLATTTRTTLLHVLGRTAFDTAWTEGAALSLDAAIAESRAAPVSTPKASPPPMPAVQRRPRARLSAREQQVLEMLAAGLADRQIAAALGISPRTAQVHVANILTKLDVTSRTAAVAVALRDGLVAQLAESTSMPRPPRDSSTT